MLFRFVGILAHLRLSRSMRPTKVTLKPEESLADTPEGWAEVLVPLGDEQPLGTPGHSHSQVGQDQLVQAILNCKHAGFYLDLASNDAVVLSNTLMLERDYGWTGICLEANPQYMLKLSHRNCKVILAAVGDGSEVQFAFKDIYGGIVDDSFDNHDEEGQGQTTTMQTTPLRKILSDVGAPERIDYLSLDVEGAEFYVMSDFPFDAHTISVITVERPKEPLKQLLQNNGYRFLRKNAKWDDETWVHDDIYNAISEGNWQQWQQSPDDEFKQNCAPINAA